MEKKQLSLENFLSDISPDFEMLVREIHDKLTGHGCAVKLQEAKSGHVVSYTDPGSKKTVANLVARKKGPMVRLYGDNVAGDQALVDSLPAGMRKDIAKSAQCKRLLDPTKCNARCAMGYQLTVDGEPHKKCRYGCFMFLVNSENTPAILELVDREMAARAG